jgi:site-specific DNA recombinase
MAVIYARQSLDRDGDGTAVGRQLEKCRLLASARELVVSEEITENDTSASKGKRPGFERLLGLIAAGEVSVIIVWNTDRLYRRVADLVKLMDLAERHDVSIMAVNGGDLDLTSSQGRMFATMTASVARYEVEHKGERQVAANQQRAREGKRHFGNRPYGYERADGVIRIIEPEASVLREAVNRAIAGESWHSIAKDFAARGIVGISGRPFSYQNLRLRAINPANAGVRTYLGEVTTEDGDWPPIVDKTTWERFQTALAARAQTQGWDKKIKYLGSGIYLCGKCGGVMKVLRDYGRGRTDHPPVYQCVNMDVRRRLAPVDALVDDAVIARLSAPDAIRLLTPTEDVAALAAEAGDVRARIDGLAALYADGTLSAAAVREQKAKLQRHLDSLHGRMNATEGGSILSGLITADSIADHWHNTMSIQNKRRVVAALMTVTIHPTKRGGSNTFRREDVTTAWRS